MWQRLKFLKILWEIFLPRHLWQILLVDQTLRLWCCWEALFRQWTINFFPVFMMSFVLKVDNLDILNICIEYNIYLILLKKFWERYNFIFRPVLAHASFRILAADIEGLGYPANFIGEPSGYLYWIPVRNTCRGYWKMLP